MTIAEFSSQFDVLYNNILSNAAPGLDEYEKSVLLTKAQDEILKSHLTPYGNKYRQGIDDSPKRQVDFSMLTTEVDTDNGITSEGGDRKYALPSDIFSALTETVKITQTGETAKSVSRVIVPIAYEEYQRILAKPYPYPLKRQVWRIMVGQDQVKPVVKLVFTPSDEQMLQESGATLKYTLRYIRKPKPIILTDLSEMGLTIDDEEGPSGCEVDPILHTEILQRAIELAKSAYGSDTNGQLQLQNQITVGQRSE